MTIYSLYIYDRYPVFTSYLWLLYNSQCTVFRHCTCVYYQDWHRSKVPKPAAEGGLLPAVSRQVYPQPSQEIAVSATTVSGFSNPRNTLSSSSGVIVAVSEDQRSTTPAPPQAQSSLSFDEEAKLVYGVVLSLRNMIKKLSGKYVRNWAASCDVTLNFV